MSTTTQASPEVKPVITEADAIAFFAEKNKQLATTLAPLCKGAGLNDVHLVIFTSHEAKIHISAYDADYTSVVGNGTTIEAAVEAFTAHVKERTPTASKLRADAESLIARAQQLEEAATTAGEEASQ